MKKVTFAAAWLEIMGTEVSGWLEKYTAREASVGWQAPDISEADGLAQALCEAMRGWDTTELLHTETWAGGEGGTWEVKVAAMGMYDVVLVEFAAAEGYRTEWAIFAVPTDPENI